MCMFIQEDPLGHPMDRFRGDFYPMHMGPPFPHPMHPPFPPHPPLPPGAEPFPGGWLPHHHTPPPHFPPPPPPPHHHHNSPYPPHFGSRPQQGGLPPKGSPPQGPRYRDPPQKDEFGRDISKRLEYDRNHSQQKGQSPERSDFRGRESSGSRQSSGRSPRRSSPRLLSPPRWRRDNRDHSERDRGEYRVQSQYNRSSDRLQRKYFRRRQSSSNENSPSATPSSRMTPSNTGSEDEEHGRRKDRRDQDGGRNRVSTYDSLVQLLLHYITVERGGGGLA